MPMHAAIPSTKGRIVSAPVSPANDLTPLPVQPALEPVQPAVEPVVELRPASESATAPLMALGLAAALHPERPDTATTVRVLARLSNGERIEVGAHPDEDGAKAEATALMRFLREPGSDWPFLNGRFVRPEAIVSIDIVL
jgi:hypothetical protein